MSPLTDKPSSQIRSRTLFISITFIILFAFVFFLNFPLQSNPLKSSTTFAALTSHLFSVTNLSSLPNTTVSSPAFAPVAVAHSPSTRLVENESSSCDMFDGNWVYDDSDPIYKPGSCPFVDDTFNCFNNGRPDLGYLNFRWQPYGCDIPRFDEKRMMEDLKGKQMVFVGDSLSRNMWESLVCSLEMFNVTMSKRRNGVSIEIKGYNSSVTRIVSPFLVQHWKGVPRSSGRAPIVERLQIDVIQETVSKYSGADFLIFNTGHWWNHNKTLNGENFFQEGDVLHKQMDLGEAYTKALNTWANWVDNNVNKTKTRVFFVGFSAAHFGRRAWNSGGGCERETEPIQNEKDLQPYPWLMKTLESVISNMSTPVTYLNITKLTDYRKDAHPSIYRLPGSKPLPGVAQDCSHWCLPGVPDTWNQLLFASLLSPSNSN